MHDAIMKIPDEYTVYMNMKVFVLKWPSAAAILIIH